MSALQGEKRGILFSVRDNEDNWTSARPSDNEKVSPGRPVQERDAEIALQGLLLKRVSEIET